MDKVLFVDGDTENLKNLQHGFQNLNQFRILTASDGQQALETLQNERVAVLVTEINLPKLDGIELLAFMTREHPSVPCIVMTDYGKPWFRNKNSQQDVLYHIEKPVDISAMASAILVGLNIKDEGLSHNKGMSMNSFLPLIELEQKTCRLEVKSPDRGRGFIYFNKGILIDAHYENLSGEKAAQDMVQWDNISVKITELPRTRTRKRVKSDLMDLTGATWLKEEVGIFEDKIEAEVEALLGDEHAERPAEPAAAPPIVDERASPSIESAESVLKRHIDAFRRINGYQAFGILDGAGTVLAEDSVYGKIDIKKLAPTLNSVLNAAKSACSDTPFQPCSHITLHSEFGIVLMLCATEPDQPHFHLIVVLSPGGNWYFTKVQLEKMLPRMAEEMTAA